MKLEALDVGLGKLLKVDAPWEILSTDVQLSNKVVDISIGFIRGSTFACSECNTDCKVHDSSIHRIRHLDLFEYRCYLNVKVPRTRCPEHGVKVIASLPRGHTGSHYSFFLSS